jgi:hypothetical protein
MAAFINLTSPRARVKLGLTLADGVTMHCTPSKLALELRGCQVHDKDGAPIEPQLKANQKVQLFLGKAAPKAYQMMVEAHPDLYAAGQVQMARIVEPDDIIELGIYFKADRAIDISELPWVARIYHVD